MVEGHISRGTNLYPLDHQDRSFVLEATKAFGEALRFASDELQKELHCFSGAGLHSDYFFLNIKSQPR